MTIAIVEIDVRRAGAAIRDERDERGVPIGRGRVVAVEDAGRVEARQRDELPRLAVVQVNPAHVGAVIGAHEAQLQAVAAERGLRLRVGRVEARRVHEPRMQAVVDQDVVE